jgi:hypothetical protein
LVDDERDIPDEVVLLMRAHDLSETSEARGA